MFDINFRGHNLEDLKRDVPFQIFDGLNVGCAISTENSKAEFVLNSGYTEMLSGLAKNLNDKHKDRIARENQSYNATTETILVPTMRLETLLNLCTFKTPIYSLKSLPEGRRFLGYKGVFYQ